MKRIANRPSFNLPFPGFYDSILSQELDHNEEREIEHFEEQQSEDGIALELRLTGREIGDTWSDCMNYRDAHDYLARQYVAAFDHVASEILETKLGLAFEEMTSPHEYNFETDRVFAASTWRALRDLWRISKSDKHATLAKAIAERFTSYDGFISSYSNRLADWLDKPLRDWDHNELCTLLMACLAIKGETPRDVEWAVFECMSDGDSDFWTATQNAMDWPAFESKLAELRADKEQELRAEDPDYVAPYRCPDTLDMFPQ